MTLQEIQYKAQSIISKWRDDDSAPYIEFVEELAHSIVPEPSEDLEEAADEYANKHYSEWDESWDDYNGHNVEPENDKLELMDAFIAGAKWMSIHGNDIKEL